MNYLLKTVKAIIGIMAGVGSIMILGAAGTYERVVLELGQVEPASVTPMCTIGFLLMLPVIIYAILKEMRGYKE